MIYTITFNPSLDHMIHVDCFEEGETNRSKQEEIYPGGKGFNVSTILSRLNLETTALGFVAGFTGEEIVDGNIFNNNTKIYDKYNRYHSVRPHNFPLYPPYSFSKA